MVILNLFFKICTLLLLIYIALSINYNNDQVALLIVVAFLAAGIISLFVGSKKTKKEDL